MTATVRQTTLFYSLLFYSVIFIYIRFWTVVFPELIQSSSRKLGDKSSNNFNLKTDAFSYVLYG